MLPFTRETPARTWLGFVNEADEQPASTLTTRVLPVLALAGVALLVFSGGKQEHTEHAPPPSSAAAARMKLAADSGATKAEDELVAKDEPVAEDPDPVATPATVAEPVEGQPLANPPPLAQGEPSEAQAPDAQPPEAAPTAPAPPPPEPATAPKRPRKPPKPLSPAAARRAARAASGLRSALKDGRVKASNENFAVVSANGDETGWGDAKAACSGLDIDGIRGWRLPSRGEAREIQRGKAAPRDAYWTRQRGPHDDTIYVHDPRTRRSSPWLDQEVASVVCVQPKPR